MSFLDNTENKTDRSFIQRLITMAVITLFGLLILFGRAYYLQVIKYDDLFSKAESNRTAIVPIIPNRGDIIDRNGFLLATSYSAYTLEISPARVKDVEETINKLARFIDIQPIHRRRFARQRAEASRYDSIMLRSKLSDEEVARFAAQSYRFPGVKVTARMFRTYPMGSVGSHVIGYIGRINEKEKERLDDSDESGNYRGTTHIGKQGIEEKYERELHGITGVEQLEKSSAGRPIRMVSTTPSRLGSTIQLSIDIRLQRMIEEMFGTRRGALVAIDPNNGEILAMVSMPTYNPNIFIEGIDQETWSALNESIERPLFNRALRGTYPPGSTYKPFMALAALETGSRTENTTIQDNGTWMLGNHRYRSGYALGSVNLRRSIERSSNVYYYSLAYEMGVDAIHNFMQPIGFGQLTGIDLIGESRGILPNKEWKRKAFKNPKQKSWIAGDTVSLGIGQGYNSFTILQLAHATATIANRGISYQPHLAKLQINPAQATPTPLFTNTAQNLGYNKDNIAAVIDGMHRVVLNGTSQYSFANATYASAGKTGTAQAATVGQNQRYNAATLAEHKRDHSLYIAFAPLEKPKIALAIIVENAGFGSSFAAPIARRVLDYWVSGIYPSQADLNALQNDDKVTTPIGTPRSINEINLPNAALPADKNNQNLQ